MTTLPAAVDLAALTDGAPLPWSVLLRDARAAGITRDRLRTPEWRLISRGLRARHDDQPLAVRAAALSQVLPRDSGFGHLTSAAVRGWWLPNQLTEHPWLATTRSRVHVQRQGMYVRRSRHAEFDIVCGVVCVSAAHTLLELARDLSLLDLVPMVDCALREGACAEEILQAAELKSRGSLGLRRAVVLADRRSESWWESILRLQHTVVGLGPVACQTEIHDGPRFVARADLHLVGTSRYPECDGGGHRDREQHLSDLRRDKDLHRLGLDRYGYTTAEIAWQPDLVIRDGEDARGVPHDPRRVATWRRLAASSTLTGHGRARLRARLHRYSVAHRR